MKCPGQDSRYWKPGAIFDVKCPNCGTMIEFFKDDTRRRCPGCGNEVPNPEMDFGCAAYCPYAEHCLGALPEGVVADGKMKVLKAKMLKMLKEKAHAANDSSAPMVRFMELVEEIGKKESAPLGPTMFAAFGFCVMELESKEDVSGKPSIHERLKNEAVSFGIEEDALNEALSILDGLLGNMDAPESISSRVIKDARTLALYKYSKNNEPQEDRLLTDSARQILKNKKAIV